MTVQHASPTAACPVCGGTAIEEFLTLRGVPVHCNILWPAREAARTAPRGDLVLDFCRGCAHVWNAAFDPAAMEYTQAYENSLHFSPRFQAYAEALADRLVREYGLRGKSVIDIGCGKGDFLAMLVERGGNTGYGFDPSYVPGLVSTPAVSRMTIIREFYSPKFASYAADLISCRHVLEHIQDPRSFLDNVRQSAGNREGTAVFFEVPNLLYTLRDLGIWDLIYEHCSYFSPPSLTALFTRQGFHVRGTSEMYEGQFLGIDATLGGGTGEGGDRERAITEIAGLVEAFGRRYREKVAWWGDRFASFRASGKRVVVWGGGSKGVTFLNTLGVRDEVTYTIDINPRKHGHFVAGTGQPVAGPETLKEFKPDVVLVMNGVYRDEIAAQLASFGLTPEILLA
jgi:SAM-dependent methyltransferase